MKLRSFLYLNTKILDDYISSIDGYVYDAEARTENFSHQKGIGAKIGVGVVSGDGNLGKTVSEEVTKEVRVNAPAKFERIYSYLSQDEGIKYYEVMEDEIFEEISRDDFIEVLVTPRFSKMKELLDTARKFSELANVFETLSDETIVDTKTKGALEGISKLGEIKKNKEISCVFNFEDTRFPMVAYLDEQYFNVPMENFVGQVNMLCKIQKKLPKGQNIKLDELFEDFKNMPLNRQQRREMSKDLNNPSEFRDVVKGPAFVVLPIAVFL